MSEPRTYEKRSRTRKVRRLSALAGAALCATAIASPPAWADPATFLRSSDDGSRVFFTTTQKLVPGDTDTRADVYERAAATTRVISQGPTGGNDALAAQFAGASDDGSRVFFTTDESMVPTDTDFARDVYERSGGATTLISTGPAGGNGNFDSDLAGSTPDGSVAFLVTNEALVGTDTDSSFDIYARSGTTTTLVSTGATGGNGAFSAFYQGTSADGSVVFFSTDEQLTSADTDSSRDIYERSSGSTSLVSTGSAGGNGAFDAIFSRASANGSKAFFETAESVEAGDTDSSQDVYERSAGTTTLLSTGGAGGNGAFAATFAGATGDGSQVFIETSESLVLGDSDSSADVYERSGSSMTRVSTGSAGGNAESPAFFEKVSVDGSRVLFSTQEALETVDSDSSADVYDRSGGATALVSGMSGAGNGAFDAFFSGASTDGTKVFFGTREQLGGGDADSNIDYYQREVAAFTLITTGPLSGVSADPTMTGLSADGARVFFETPERLTSDDLDTELDVYERSGGTTTLVTIGNSAPVGPGTPALTATDPASPSNDNTPLVQGQADAGTSIKIYSSADCSGAPVGTGSAADLQGAGIQVTVPSDSNTTLRATATDAQGDVSDCGTTAVTYTEDSTPPAAPSLTGSSPASPANDNSPEIQGSADSGSTVALYDNGGCTGAPVATGSAATLAGAGITVSVPDDSVTTLHGTAADSAGNVSGCSSSSVTYQEVSTAPAAPTLTSVTPASPANQNNPSVHGSAAAGTTVQIYTNPSCNGTPVASGTAAQLGGAGIGVTVADNSTTTVHATATVVGNVSPCSATSVTFVEDSAAPAAPQLAKPAPGSPANDNSPRLSGFAEAGAQVRLFEGGSCAGAPVATGSAAGLAGGIAVSVPDNSTTTFSANAVDPAGNASACSNEVKYVEDSADPNTRITFAPGVVTRDRTPVFRFTDMTGDEGTKFLCRIDKRRFRPCKAPRRFKRLRRGRHKFRVKAIDAAGNQEDGPATLRFRIVSPK